MRQRLAKVCSLVGKWKWLLYKFYLLFLLYAYSSEENIQSLTNVLKTVMRDEIKCEHNHFVPQILNSVFIPGFSWIKPSSFLHCKQCSIVPYLLSPILSRFRGARDSMLNIYGTRNTTISFISYDKSRRDCYIYFNENDYTSGTKQERSFRKSL